MSRTLSAFARDLAVNGFIPVVSAIAPFISMRCYEQVRDDIGYVNTNVKIIGSSSGISQSQLGSTHQANEDIALMRTVPHMVILNPAIPLKWKCACVKRSSATARLYPHAPPGS